MAEIRLRPKHQLTLPASIVREAGLQANDRLAVSFSNGHIIITPKPSHDEKDDVLAYAGIFSGAWGDTPEETEATIHQLRSEWTR